MPTDYINNPEDIKLNTHDEVDQILGRPPGWLLKYGITIIFLFFGILATLSILLEYPDKIPARVEIITQRPAIKVIAKASGKINQLFVENNEQVEQDAIIGILDNPAAMEDVEELSDFLEDIEKSTKSELLKTPLPENLKLGNIQFSYAALKQKINDLRYFRNSDDVDKKIKSLKNQIYLKRKLNDNLKKQKTKLIQEIDLSKNNLDRNKTLHENEIVSTIEIEKLETQVLQQQRQLDALENQLVNNNISKEEIRTTIIDLQQIKKDGSSNRQLNIAEEIESIKSEIDLWRQTYLITAPITGQVSFSNIFSEQQFVNVNEEVLTIVPIGGKGEIVARAYLPIANSGKVQPGQRVNVQLDGFPYQEWGIIVAEVEDISLVPFASGRLNEDSYLVDIKLPETLVTTYKKTIPFRQEMRGTANIITEDRKVIARILDRVFNVTRNN
ncbi:MAG: HlyD family secretion protein [Saprospiraceae bacterium]